VYIIAASYSYSNKCSDKVEGLVMMGERAGDDGRKGL
jgi:hypothetical protein